MKILLINHYAGSPAMGMEYRPYYMAREWAKAGHEVVIIAASFAHVRTIQPQIKNKLQEEIIDGITYLWVKTPEYHGNGLKRILNMFSFYRTVKTHARTLALKYKPDSVIASSTYPMDNYAAAKIAKISGAGHFYEVHDLWPLSPMELGGYRASHPFIKYLQKAEDFAYKNADGVISMLPKTLEYMQSRGLKPEKWHYVPNGINKDEWENSIPLTNDVKTRIESIRKEYKFIIEYTGSIGIANALKSFAEAASFFRNKEAAFVIVGKGPEKENLQKTFSSVENLFFLDSVSKQCIPSLLSYADFLYIGLQRQSLFRFGVSPNKLFDYMMAGKPIIQAIDAGNDPVSESGCGISIEPENPKALTDAINTLMNMPPELRQKMGDEGKKHVILNHDYSVLADSFLKILTDTNNS